MHSLLLAYKIVHLRTKVRAALVGNIRFLFTALTVALAAANKARVDCMLVQGEAGHASISKSSK
jgi:hypothetical protein